MKNTDMKGKIIMLIKFIIIASICYLLLAYNIFNIGEKLVPSTKDYLHIDIPEANQDLEEQYLDIPQTPSQQTGHFSAADIKNIDTLCKSMEICNKIDFSGSFTDTERYAKLSGINKIIKFISDNSKRTKKIQDVISSIVVKKDTGNRRGYATRDSIIFNIWTVKSNKEFIELSAHEMGHITDLGYIQWVSLRKDRNYTEFGKAVFAINDPSLSYYRLSRDKESIRKAEAKKKDFCSGYGMSDPFEDFSECFNLYINHNALFKEIAKTDTILRRKYNYIAGIFSGKYISSNSQDISLVKNDTVRRPRDTTKISN